MLRQPWIGAAVIIVGVYGLYVLGIYLLQHKLVFQPTDAWLADPGDLGLSYDDVRLQTADGIELHGWYLPAAGSGADTLLYLHGNGGNVSHRLEHLQLLTQHIGVNTLIIDYRGYGRSQGEPSERGSYRDADAALEYLRARHGLTPSQILILGHSLGGAVAARTAAEHGCKALILEASFVSLPALAAQITLLAPARWLLRISYDTAAHLQRVSAPVLIIHGRDDRVVPASHGRRLFEQATAPKDYLATAGGHDDLYIVDPETYLAGFRRFLKEQARARLAPASQ